MNGFQQKKVLFVTTKNLDYLRNTQEIGLIQQQAESVTVIGSVSKSYPKRLLHVYSKIFFGSLKQYDTIFIGFAPQLVLPFFRWKMKNKEIIIDFFISMYDTFVCDRNKFKDGSFFANILKWLDRKTIQGADRVIADTKEHGNFFVEEFGVNPNRLEVLYLNADTSIYYPREQKKPERMKDCFTVLYFGSVLPLQGLDVILEAIDKMKQDEKFYFIVIGPIQDKFKKPESSRIEYHEWLSQEDLAEYISYADLCLAGHFNANINKAKRTIPGKAYIYEAMEKPMILGDNPATHELYDESMDGIYFVTMGDSDALVEKIREAGKRYE